MEDLRYGGVRSGYVSVPPRSRTLRTAASALRYMQKIQTDSMLENCLDSSISSRYAVKTPQYECKNYALIGICRSSCTGAAIGCFCLRLRFCFLRRLCFDSGRMLFRVAVADSFGLGDKTAMTEGLRLICSGWCALLGENRGRHTERCSNCKDKKLTLHHQFSPDMPLVRRE